MEIPNPFLPLALLNEDILESKTARIQRKRRTDLQKSFNIGGQRVSALVVEDRGYERGQLTEVAFDYFAQDDDGTGYYLGEKVDEYQKSKSSGHSPARPFDVATH